MPRNIKVDLPKREKDEKKAAALVVWVLVIAIILGFIYFVIRDAEAHEWYPVSCCSATDCYEIDPSELSAVEGGWRVNRTGEIFAPNSLSLKQTPAIAGGTWHRCSRQAGNRDAETICIFVPPMGF